MSWRKTKAGLVNCLFLMVVNVDIRWTRLTEYLKLPETRDTVVIILLCIVLLVLSVAGILYSISQYNGLYRDTQYPKQKTDGTQGGREKEGLKRHREPNIPANYSDGRGHDGCVGMPETKRSIGQSGDRPLGARQIDQPSHLPNLTFFQIQESLPEGTPTPKDDVAFRDQKPTSQESNIAEAWREVWSSDIVSVQTMVDRMSLIPGVSETSTLPGSLVAVVHSEKRFFAVPTQQEFKLCEKYFESDIPAARFAVIVGLNSPAEMGGMSGEVIKKGTLKIECA